MNLSKDIFGIGNEQAFNHSALKAFHIHYETNSFYREYSDSVSVNPSRIDHYRDIPFLPIEFFKSQQIILGEQQPEKIFISSGTTGIHRSRHFVTDLSLYRKSLLRGFEMSYGSPQNCIILSLTPSPEENPDSSLVFMIRELIAETDVTGPSFFLNRFELLAKKLKTLRDSSKKVMLIGLSYALLDFAEVFPVRFPALIVMETGGMKGTRKEMIREELHTLLSQRFGVEKIHSEYGMTELLSQAYSPGDGIFHSPPWMKILIRDPSDPLSLLGPGQTGGINVIDLANFNSCPFIATQDLGLLHDDGSFEVVGRFDSSDIRGCSLMSY